METKKCSHCGRILSLDHFSRKTKSKDGLQPYCKECTKEIQRKWRASKDESDAKTYYPSNAVAPADETNVLEKFTPRQLLKELKRRGYRWSGMSVVMTIDYDSI